MDERARRKELRAEAKNEYKERTRRVRELQRNEDPVKIQEIITEDLSRSDELYTLVKKKLDGTAADSRHIRELVSLCQESSKRINASSKPIELKKIILNLMREVNDEAGKELSSQEFSRFITEQYVNTFLLKPPTFEFFYGALRSEGIVVKVKKQRAPREKVVETQAVTAKERDIEVEVEQDTTPKEVEHINTQIKRLAKNKPEGIAFFATLVDPNSFTQTVENIFHTSFLVKEGHIGVKRDDKSRRPILIVDPDRDNSGRSQEVERPSAGEGNQSILSFSMADYNDWISSYNIRRCSFEPRADLSGDGAGPSGIGADDDRIDGDDEEDIDVQGDEDNEDTDVQVDDDDEDTDVEVDDNNSDTEFEECQD